MNEKISTNQNGRIRYDEGGTQNDCHSEKIRLESYPIKNFYATRCVCRHTINSNHNSSIAPYPLKFRTKMLSESAIVKPKKLSENFFSCLKCECVHLQNFKTREEAKTAVFRYIEA